MALIGPRVKNVSATATVAGGAGAATANIAVPSGYKLRALVLGVGTIAAAGTISVKDNAGAGAELLNGTAGHTVGTDPNSKAQFYNALTVTTPLTVTVASGGANGNLCIVRATFVRTRSH
jgi:hypothetical protein